MNKSKWAQELAVPVRPLEEVLKSFAQLMRNHEGLLRRLDAIRERQRELGAAVAEEWA